ncbi:unnamed protein product [Auanema sp. JU1783]|nr:unnamed protein product [Auanema sp. JU1783]
MPVETNASVVFNELEDKKGSLEFDTVGMDEDAQGAPQYPCNADDLFEIRLIDAVEKNQCIYNRCHPLHKMADYKTHIWSLVAKEVNYGGPAVELERKWRHMRDRYVRLRKVVKTTQPLKKTDKWYFYYQKMSFLDPYVEHRNRRKRGEMLTSMSNPEREEVAHQDCPTDSFTDRQEEDGSDSGEGETEIDPLKGFYASFLSSNNSNNILVNTPEAPLPKLEASDIQKPSPPAPVASTSGTSLHQLRKRRMDEGEDELEDTEVSLFVRSIHKTLSGMDARTFALARLEISRVLFDCQFGSKESKS